MMSTDFSFQLPLIPDDNHGYFPRDPLTVQIRTDEQFRAFSQHLIVLLGLVDGLNAAIDPAYKAPLEMIRSELGSLRTDSRLLMALLHEQGQYIQGLMAQRQSSREAYTRGWDDRLQDILSQLHPEDHRMLRWILNHLDAQDRAEADDLPF